MRHSAVCRRSRSRSPALQPARPTSSRTGRMGTSRLGVSTSSSTVLCILWRASITASRPKGGSLGVSDQRPDRRGLAAPGHVSTPVECATSMAGRTIDGIAWRLGGLARPPGEGCPARDTVFAARQAGPASKGCTPTATLRATMKQRRGWCPTFVESTGLRPIDVGPLAVARTRSRGCAGYTSGLQAEQLDVAGHRRRRRACH